MHIFPANSTFTDYLIPTITLDSLFDFLEDHQMTWWEQESVQKNTCFFNCICVHGNDFNTWQDLDFVYDIAHHVNRFG